MQCGKSRKRASEDAIVTTAKFNKSKLYLTSDDLIKKSISIDIDNTNYLITIEETKSWMATEKLN